MKFVRLMGPATCCALSNCKITFTKYIYYSKSVALQPFKSYIKIKCRSRKKPSHVTSV